jgi:hypothetical protein
MIWLRYPFCILKQEKDAIFFFHEDMVGKILGFGRMCRSLARARRRNDPSQSGELISGFLFCEKRIELPPSIMITRKPNWSFRDSKARD